MTSQAVAPAASHKSAGRRPGVVSILLPVLFAACIARLWLAPLSSSLWVDELVTVFVVQHPGHTSFAVAPQVPESLYYWFPRASAAAFGSSEAAWRLPSILFMSLALLAIVGLARRLIHPDAGWFAVAACFALHGFNYFAIDARPYGMGIAVASASVLFLVKWLDYGRWWDASLFFFFAALLWRVHLVYWPFYVVYALYFGARLARHRVAATGRQMIAVTLALVTALLPVAFTALRILRGAHAHAFAPEPSLRDFAHLLRWNLVAICGACAWILSLCCRWTRVKCGIRRADLSLLLAWWLVLPVCLFVWSLLTHNSVYVARYLSLMLPGVALTATALVARWLPERQWQSAAAALAGGALLFLGQWNVWKPRHENSDWRAAAMEEYRLAASSGTPVICPSPFIEARSPAWTPDYPLPGFLYAHLDFYPIRGKPDLFPFESSPEAERFASVLVHDQLEPSGRFVIYGPAGGARYWKNWFAARPELAGWSNRLEEFGDVYVAEFVSSPKAPVSAVR
ncbi:MAG TPA: glycosyltransferase family 39 protein [Bryobacteraceae bacterium]|nr:glycosyltransferase family 39 protein [Bryobacteraceae bacterium]